MKVRGCAKPTIELVQLNGGCVAPPTFPLAPLDFEYLALLQVYTFFQCIVIRGRSWAFKVITQFCYSFNFFTIYCLWGKIMGWDAEINH